jgi:histidinol-phosphate phosphatase family protein
MAEDVPYCPRPEDFKLFPGTAKAVRLLNEHGFKVLVVTNQSGVARGYFTGEALAQVHAKMESVLDEEGARLDGIYYCPHHPDDGCDCRKPKTKMVLQAATDHDIDIERSFIVGDLDTDIELGKAVGCSTVLIAQHPGTNHEPADYTAADLHDAAQWIMKQR